MTTDNTTMVREVVIDVSELEAPQPFEEVLRQIKRLRPGEYIHMLHRKQPLPLLQLLEENGYVAVMRKGDKRPWEIYIWNTSDPLSSEYCRNHFVSE